jgi:DNA invertase Pin-like site-specific DNA recombinase
MADFVTFSISHLGICYTYSHERTRARTQAGLLAARAFGRKCDRSKALTPKKAKMLHDLYRNKENSIDEICKTLNISRTTLYRYIKPGGGNLNEAL